MIMSMMKSSNTEWLGDIPAEWDVAQIGNYYELRNEKVSDYDFEPLSVTMKGIVPQLATAAKSDDHSNRKLVKKGDFVINSRSDRRGSCGISPLDGSVSLINIVMEPRGEMNPQYYNWLFHTERFADEFYKWGHGIVDDLWTTRWQEMKKILIVAPSPDEQQTIADYLDETCSKIDEIIAEAKASIDEYKNLREAVISNATTRGIKKNRSMKSSGVEWLPEIPADWNVLSPKVVFTQRKDRAIKGERQLTASQKHGIMYQDDYMKEEGVRIVTVEKDFSILKHVEPDNFVISMRSFQGGLEYSYLRGCISSAYVMLIPNHKYVYSEYYKWFFKSDKYINALQSTSDLIRDGQALRYANFVKLKLFDIPIEEQKEIADYLNKKVPKIDSLIAEKESLINDLEAYKKSLIYEVVTGKRRVV